jgi:hypothetical protein
MFIHLPAFVQVCASVIQAVMFQEEFITIQVHVHVLISISIALTTAVL